MNILVALDGVLSSESGEPNRTGVLLYYALNEGHRVTIITDRKKADAEHWLKSHGIINYDDLVGDEVHLEGEELRKRQFLLTRSKVPLELYIDSDPSMCAWVFEEQHIPILLLTHPSYSPVENRPDAPSKVRKWSDIEAAIDKANVARSEQRLRPKEADLWQD
mgnify:CR=1